MWLTVQLNISAIDKYQAVQDAILAAFAKFLEPSTEFIHKAVKAAQQQDLELERNSFGSRKCRPRRCHSVVLLVEVQMVVGCTFCWQNVSCSIFKACCFASDCYVNEVNTKKGWYPAPPDTFYIADMLNRTVSHVQKC